MPKKKPYHDLLKVIDPVTRNILLAFIHKVHTKLCNLQQTVGYVPYYKGIKSDFIWTDMRKRGRSTFGDQPTIKFVPTDGSPTIYLWWNRHLAEKADVLAAPTPTLEQIQMLEDAFNDEIADWSVTLDDLTRISVETGIAPDEKA